MKIQIVSIADEILLGNTINTNASFISSFLKELGYRASSHVVIGDEPKELEEKLKKSLLEYELVIATGGLGPTYDDNTKKVVANLFRRKIIEDKALKKELFERFKKNKYIEEQSNVIEGAKILKNEIGTAPGFILEKDKKVLIVLPGVPYEMKRMLPSIKQYLEEKFIREKKVYQEIVNICLLLESQVEAVLEEIRKLDEDVEIGIYPSFASVKVSFTVEEKDEKKAKSKIAPLKAKLLEKFKDFIFDAPSHKIEEALKNIFLKNNQTLALAESCSGGALAATLTSLVDSSKFFLGSIVSYSNELKENILKVPKSILEEKGAVSIETVDEMVNGIFKITSATYAIAISGIAGPGGGTATKPVGTVCIAVGKRGEKTDSGIIHVPGDRGFIVKYCKDFALSLLWVRINADLTYFLK